MQWAQRLKDTVFNLNHEIYEIEDTEANFFEIFNKKYSSKKSSKKFNRSFLSIFSLIFKPNSPNIE